jgi:DNA-binding CsgD family transcriptional regulator
MNPPTNSDALPSITGLRAGLWTTEEIRTLRLLAGKIPAKEIARIMNRSYQRMHDVAARHGIKLAMHGADHHASKHPDLIVEITRRLSEEIPVLSYSQIGRIVGVHPKTLAEWCRFDKRTSDPVNSA